MIAPTILAYSDGSQALGKGPARGAILRSCGRLAQKRSKKAPGASSQTRMHKAPSSGQGQSHSTIRPWPRVAPADLPVEGREPTRVIMRHASSPWGPPWCKACEFRQQLNDHNRFTFNVCKLARASARHPGPHFSRRPDADNSSRMGALRCALGIGNGARRAFVGQ